MLLRLAAQGQWNIWAFSFSQLLPCRSRDGPCGLHTRGAAQELVCCALGRSGEEVGSTQIQDNARSFNKVDHGGNRKRSRRSKRSVPYFLAKPFPVEVRASCAAVIETVCCRINHQHGTDLFQQPARTPDRRRCANPPITTGGVDLFSCRHYELGVEPGDLCLHRLRPRSKTRDRTIISNVVADGTVRVES